MSTFSKKRSIDNPWDRVTPAAPGRGLHQERDSAAKRPMRTNYSRGKDVYAQLGLRAPRGGCRDLRESASIAPSSLHSQGHGHLGCWLRLKFRIFADLETVGFLRPTNGVDILKKALRRQPLGPRSPSYARTWIAPKTWLRYEAAHEDKLFPR